MLISWNQIYCNTNETTQVICEKGYEDIGLLRV